MEEFEKMTDEELNAIIVGANTEIKKRQAIINKDYNDRYRALRKVEKAFHNYYSTFNREYPCMWLEGVHDKPVQVQMLAIHDKTEERPYLYFYHK